MVLPSIQVVVLTDEYRYFIHKLARSFWFTGVTLLTMSLAVAGPAAALSLSSQDSRPTVAPARLDERPNIDGRLDEPLWDRVEPLTEFTQYEPDNGAPATERTEVRVAYDDENLYFGIRAFDNDPERIIARQFGRDSMIDTDDSISIGIDSLDDNRTAVAFQTNVLGAKLDAQLAETGSYNVSWNTIWYAEGNVDEFGYTIEIGIPWFSLRFTPGENLRMGLILERIIRRKNETVYWPYLSRDYSFRSVSQYAHMVELGGLERSVDLEVKPYGLAGLSELPGDRTSQLDAGLDLKWGITSDITADFAVNPDFAHIESDNLQVNLTRFNLFYPEKRDFFLERADLFRFGVDYALNLGHTREVEVFFSRRIGLRAGRAVPILAGMRAYGQAGNTNFGAMSLRTRASNDYPAEQFSVARVRQNVFGRSSIGGIYTHRSGDPLLADTTVGADAQFLFGTNFVVRGAAARSDHGAPASGNWFLNAVASQSKDLYQWSVQYMDIGENFRPGIGFVRRADQRQLAISGLFKPRPAWSDVRQFALGGQYKRTENHAGQLETRDATLGSLIFFESQDQLTVAYADQFEFIPRPFMIAPGVIVPPGEYENRIGVIDFQGSPSRRWRAIAGAQVGSLYGGDIRAGTLAFEYAPVPRVKLGLSTSGNRVILPGGSFDSVISRLAASYAFSPELNTRAVVQHSLLFDEFLLNFRVRWIYKPGSEAWLVYDEGRRFDVAGPSFRDRTLVFKVVHNFHF